MRHNGPHVPPRARRNDAIEFTVVTVGRRYRYAIERTAEDAPGKPGRVVPSIPCVTVDMLHGAELHVMGSTGIQPGERLVTPLQDEAAEVTA